jgi:hypothetical protein
MPITQVDIEGAEQLIDDLLGNQEEAENYAKDPEGWLNEHGYANVNPEALAQCGAAYGAGGAAATSAGAASSGVAGIAAALDPVVYNHYYEVDNSITNNIENHGNLDFNQQIGDGNVNVNDSVVEGDIQTQTGDGIQMDDSNIVDSNVATGDDNQQAIDESINDSFNVDLELDVDPEPPLVLRAAELDEPAPAPEEALEEV